MSRMNVADSDSEKRFSFDKTIENQSLQQNMTTPFFHISPPPKAKPPKRDPEERNIVVVVRREKGGNFTVAGCAFPSAVTHCVPDQFGEKGKEGWRK